MGALLSIPLLVIPSAGTVRCLRSLELLLITDDFLRCSLSERLAVERQRARQYAVLVESSKAGK
jgi:hypothetical protein